MSNIQVGDLVMVVRSHCGGALAQEGGLILPVLRVEHFERGVGLFCPSCKQGYAFEWINAEVVPGGWHPVAWLKKIPPLVEPTTETMKEVA